MFFSSTSSYIASASDIDLCCWCCSHLETHLSRLIETNLFLSAFLSFMCEMFYVLKNEESSQSRRWLKSWQRDLKRSWNEQGYNVDTWIYVHSFKQSQFSGECRSAFNILTETLSSINIVSLFCIVSFDGGLKIKWKTHMLVYEYKRDSWMSGGGAGMFEFAYKFPARKHFLQFMQIFRWKEIEVAQLLSIALWQ